MTGTHRNAPLPTQRDDSVVAALHTRRAGAAEEWSRDRAAARMAYALWRSSHSSTPWARAMRPLAVRGSRGRGIGTSFDPLDCAFTTMQGFDAHARCHKVERDMTAHGVIVYRFSTSRETQDSPRAAR